MSDRTLDGQTDRQGDRQIGRHTDRQKDRPVESQVGRRTDRQIDIESSLQDHPRCVRELFKRMA